MGDAFLKGGVVGPITRETFRGGKRKLKTWNVRRSAAEELDPSS